MKNLTTKLMIAAAALVAVAGTASAQTMEANIRFAFRASDKVLPAGTYRVQLQASSGSEVLIISARGGKHEMLAIAYPNGPAASAWQSAGDSVLSFQCGVSRCALKNIWMGAGDAVYAISVHKLGRDEPVHTAEIVLRRVKGD